MFKTVESHILFSCYEVRRSRTSTRNYVIIVITLQPICEKDCLMS